GQLHGSRPPPAPRSPLSQESALSKPRRRSPSLPLPSLRSLSSRPCRAGSARKMGGNTLSFAQSLAGKGVKIGWARGSGAASRHPIAMPYSAMPWRGCARPCAPPKAQQTPVAGKGGAWVSPRLRADRVRALRAPRRRARKLVMAAEEHILVAEPAVHLGG